MVAPLFAVAPLIISFAIFRIDAVAFRQPIALDEPTTYSTLLQFCVDDSECNADLYEQCSPFKYCACDRARNAFYVAALQRCVPCPNAVQRCEECCNVETHICTEADQCVERQWWFPPPASPQRFDPPVSPFTIVISLIASASVALLLWHCCCAKPLHKRAADALAAARSQRQQQRQTDVADRSPEPRDSERQTGAVSAAVPSPPAPPRFSTVDAPPPSYSEAVKIAARPAVDKMPASTTRVVLNME